MSASRQLSTKCALCSCTSGPLSLDACLERTAYCCTESIRLKCDVTNGTDQDVTLSCKLLQVKFLLLPAYSLHVKTINLIIYVAVLCLQLLKENAFKRMSGQ